MEVIVDIFEVAFAGYHIMYIKCTFQVDQCVKYIDMHSNITTFSEAWQKFAVSALL